MIGLVNASVMDPQFKNFKQAEQTLRSNSFMTYPIFSTEKELIMTFQVMGKPKRGNPQHRMPFTLVDEAFLHLIAQLF